MEWVLGFSYGEAGEHSGIYSFIHLLKPKPLTLNPDLSGSDLLLVLLLMLQCDLVLHVLLFTWMIFLGPCLSVVITRTSACLKMQRALNVETCAFQEARL